MILGSTVGAVAAVLSYHPAASTTSLLTERAPETPVETPPVAASPTQESSQTSTQTPTQTPTQTLTQSPSASATPKANTAAPKKEGKKPVTSATPAAPSPTPEVAAEQVVTGASAQTRWGPVQVQITVQDGRIVNAVGLQYPDGDRRSQMISSQAIPWLVEETLAEQIADVQIIGGATYTSMGWRESLASAMQKAGL